MWLLRLFHNKAGNPDHTKVFPAFVLLVIMAVYVHRNWNGTGPLQDFPYATAGIVLAILTLWGVNKTIENKGGEK